MRNEKKCHQCGKWTDGSQTHCEFCGALIDPFIIAREKKQKRDEAAKQKQLAEEGRFEKFLRELEESDKPFHRFSFSILNTLFNIYMAILSFFIWLIAIASG